MTSPVIPTESVFRRSFLSQLFIVMAFTLVAATSVFPLTAKASSLSMTAGSNVSGHVDTWLDLDDIEVTGTSNDPISVTVSVDSGSLRFLVNTGISFFNAVDSGSNINISGTVEDVNNALASLQYRNHLRQTVTFVASLTPSDEVFNPANGHLYEIVAADEGSINANDAKTAAENREKYGATGYLATITSQEENDYLSSRLDGDGWFGASDAQTEGDWKWISGPEAGTSFWSGLSNGSAVQNRYSNWAYGEPNNSHYGDGEDCAQFYSNGSGWNDLHCVNATLPYYVVEYGAPGDLPSVSYTSFNITTTFPIGNTTTIDECADLTTIAASPLLYRYDTINLTTNLDCQGNLIDMLFATDDEEFGPHTFRGTFNGNGNTIDNFSVESFTTSAGLIKYAEFATFSNISLGNLAQISGTECSGGLVGSAYNSAFTDIESLATVVGTENVGGIIGCLESNNNYDSSLEDSSAAGDVTATGGNAGGAIGRLYTIDDSNTTIDQVTIGGSVYSQYDTGGLIGDVEASDQSSVSIMQVTNASAINANYTAGGILGDVEVEDQANFTASTNENTATIAALEYAGGIIGSIDVESSEANVSINNNTNSGNIETTQWGGAGGIIAQLYSEGDYLEITLQNNTNSGGITSRFDDAGGIIGYTEADDDFIKVYLNECINTGAIEGVYNLGGLVGYGERLHIIDSYSTGTITGIVWTGNQWDPGHEYNYSSDVGGLVGDTEGTVITNSYATGTISAINSVGGLVGHAESETDFLYDPQTDSSVISPVVTEIYNSYFEGTINGSNSVGGIIGSTYGAHIHQSYANAEIVGVPRTIDGYYDNELQEWIDLEGFQEFPSRNVGGLVGWATYDEYGEYDNETDTYTDVRIPAKITQSYSVGTVESHTNVGGMVGLAEWIDINNSYSRMSITTTNVDAKNVGGAIGLYLTFPLEQHEIFRTSMPQINKVYVAGDITSDADYVGGLIGKNLHTTAVANSFWDAEVSGVADSAGGTGKTSAELKNIVTFTNTATPGLVSVWNFTSVWGIYENINSGYPCLSWSNNSCTPNSLDGDNDGIGNNIESAGPNNGDANNDGIPDSAQGNVASFINPVTGNYVALAVNSSCNISSVVKAAESANTVQDSGFNYPAGLMNFTVGCGTNGYTTTVQLYYYGITNSSAMVVRKYNPVNNAYFNLTGAYGATIQQTTIGGQAVAIVTYQITDGGVLDMDSSTNGTIVDPVGLATSAVGSPNTGLPKR